MTLPLGWNASRSNGYSDTHYLQHECGWRSSQPYHLVRGALNVRNTINSHVCSEVVEVVEVVDYVDPVGYVDVIDVVEVVEDVVEYVTDDGGYYSDGGYSSDW